MNNNITQRVKARLLAKKEAEEAVKTSDTPQEMSPLEREKARRRKIASKYDSYIINKLLPGLDK